MEDEEERTAPKNDANDTADRDSCDEVNFRVCRIIYWEFNYIS